MGAPRLSWSVVVVALRAVAGGATYQEAADLAGVGLNTVWSAVLFPDRSGYAASGVWCCWNASNGVR